MKLYVGHDDENSRIDHEASNAGVEPLHPSGECRQFDTSGRYKS